MAKNNGYRRPPVRPYSHNGVSYTRDFNDIYEVTVAGKYFASSNQDKVIAHIDKYNKIN